MTDAVHSPLTKSRAPIALWVGICVFLIASIPFLFGPFNPHPDERLYTVAAAEMMASGDYLVPKSETGGLRLKKPPLTYYYVVLGFKAFGETVFGAKILMVLSAAAIIGLSYSLARALGVDRDRSLLSAAMVGGHKIFFSTSNQHIPDMPLVLGISLALVGFVHILNREKPPTWVYYAAWLGVAYAVLAKGMLVLLLVALYLPFRLFRGRHLYLNKHEIFAVFIALFLAASWFLYIAQVHPEPFVAQFVGDQVTGKAGFDPMQISRGIQKTFLDLTLPALPFLVAIALTAFFGRKERELSRSERVNYKSRGVMFLLAWCAVTVIVFAFSTQLYERYILPALPAFAALTAWGSLSFSKDALTRGLKIAMRVFLPLPFLVLAVSVVFVWKFSAFGMLGLCFGAGALLLFCLWRVLGQSQFLGSVLGLALVLPLLALAILPLHATFLFPTAGQQVAALGWSNTDDVVILDSPELADDVGLQIGNIDRLHYRRSFDVSQDGAVPYVLFLNSKHLPGIEAAGYKVDTTYFLRALSIDMADLQKAWTLGNSKRFIEQHGQMLYVAYSR